MSERNQQEEAVAGFDAIGLLRTHGRTALTVALGAAGLVFVFGWIYLNWGQPVSTASALEFRPTFNGADQRQYPNGLPFSPTDVTAGPILDLAYDRGEVAAYCSREAFRGGFFVEQRSDQSVFLDLEYQARLSEPRITIVERKLLQEEHASKRLALPLQFRLVFVTPSDCAAIPRVVIAKAMISLLEIWASESETKRGVLNHQVEVLTPGVLDVIVGGTGGAILRADLLRNALQRVTDNVALVGALPGASVVRLGADRITFVEVRGKLEDLVRSRLDSLVMTAGKSLVRESFAWVNETVAAADREARAAEGNAAAYQVALREFSGSAQRSSASQASAAVVSQNSTSQPLVPQIDGSFIDRIVEMSSASARFRQQLTESMVRAQVGAVAAEQRASYYRRLLKSLQGTGGLDLSAEQLETSFEEIIGIGKALTKQFNDLYDEFSRVALRSAGSMYQVEKPVTTEVTREFTRRSLLTFVAMAFFGGLFLSLGIGVLRDRMKAESR